MEAAPSLGYDSMQLFVKFLLSMFYSSTLQKRPRKQTNTTSERVQTNAGGEADYCCLWGILSMFYHLFVSELEQTLVPRKQTNATSERVHTNAGGEVDYCCLWGILSMF